MLIFSLSAVSVLTFQLIVITTTIPLGMIQNLRFLLFSVTMGQGFEDDYFCDLISVSLHFEDPAVSATLRELTIAICA